jgi:hypothetical protein
MAIVYADRVQQTTVTTGIGPITFNGTVLGFRSFSAGVGLGNQTYYTITDEVAGDWELGLGTVGAGTFSRDAVVASSNGNALVVFAIGTKKIFVAPQAAFFAAALTLAGHAAVNHTGLPGVPAAEAFTSVAHALVNHAGLPGVGAGDLTTAAHALVNHAGFPGVGDLTTAAHALTNHAGIPGVGDLTTAAHALINHGGLPGLMSTLSALVTGGTSVASFIVPGGTLAVDGDMLVIEAYVQASAGGGTSIVTYGGPTLMNQDPLNAPMPLDIRIWRTGPLSQRYVVRTYSGAGPNTGLVFSGSLALDNALNQTLSVSDTHFGAIVSDLIVRKLPV